MDNASDRSAEDRAGSAVFRADHESGSAEVVPGSADKLLEERAGQLSTERAVEESGSADKLLERRAEVGEVGAEERAGKLLEERADKSPLKSSVPRRLMRERRWDGNVIQQRDTLMSHARKVLALPKEQAQEWVYQQLAERYPPIQKSPKRQKSQSKASAPGHSNRAKTPSNKAPESLHCEKDHIETVETVETAEHSKRGDPVEIPGDEGDRDVGVGGKQSGGGDAAIRGLDKIPASWPSLPPNASLAAEIQWVQSVRVDVVEELSSGGYRVRLNRADRPAPSKAAIGWLETSIRAYSKYCDIAAKAAANVEDEEAVAKRERLSIERVRQLLESMIDARK